MSLEAQIEFEIVRYAESTGWTSRKMSYVNRKGCRDRDFYGFGHIIMVEFKRPNGRRDGLQIKEAEMLASHKLHVYHVDAISEGKRILDWYRSRPQEALIVPSI